MKEFIKSYHLFLSQRLLRWIIYLVYPILFLVSFLLLDSRITNNSTPDIDIENLYWVLLFNMGDLALGIELLTDYLIFGGIASKYTNKLEYLKTSVKGMPYLKKALIADAVRRLISLGLVIGIPFALSAPYYTWTDAIGVTLVIFSFVETGLLITRHFSSFTASWLALSLLLIVMPASILLITYATIWLKILLPLIIGAIVAVLGRRLIIGKARKSYYDNRNEKGI